ncbi:MAG: hypothetical protein ACR2MD_00235 [Aridibacter sp.]
MRIIIFLIGWAVTFILFSCFVQNNSSTLNENNSSRRENLNNKIQVNSICELFENPDLFDNRTITVQTIFSNITSLDTFSDEKCPTRHPLIEVKFSQKLEKSFCNSNQHEIQKMCSTIRNTKEKKSDKEYVIEGIFEGQFKYFIPKEGFTLNGLRFKFFVKNLKEIRKITVSESNKLLD